MIDNVNFVYVLFAILLLLSCLFLFVYRGDFLAPSFLMSATMTISTFFAMVNVNRWDLHVGIATSIVIISSIIAFGAGGIWCSSCYAHSNFNVTISNQVPYKINNYVLTFLSIVMIVLCYFSFREMYALSVLLGNTEGYRNIIRVVRLAIEGHQIHLSRWMNYRHLLAQLIAYFYIYIFSFNTIFCGFKWREIRSLVPVLLFIPFIILTTGRMALMILLIYSVMLIAILYQKKNGSTVKIKAKLFWIFSLTGGIFVLLFFLLGIFTGKTISADRTPFIIISHYAGLSIPALDVFLNQPTVVSNHIGSNTLLGVYRAINHFGLHLPEVQIFLQFTQFNGINTNVYTAMRRYIQDFGYVGTVIIMWLLGTLYTGFYCFITKKDTSPLAIILYAIYVFPLFLSSIDERFFLDIIGTSLFYTIGVAWALYHLLLKNSLNLYKEVLTKNDNEYQNS